MNHEDLPPLQTEVGVLQKIIRVLLQQNEALKAENSGSMGICLPF